jgi:hypothetical protein
MQSNISIICWRTSKADCTSNSPINKVFRACETSYFASDISSPAIRGNSPFVNPNSNSDYVAKAIKKLNPNKSSDEFGLAAEHLKHGVEVICPALTKVLNEILTSSKSPESFKSGIECYLHPPVLEFSFF